MTLTLKERLAKNLISQSEYDAIIAAKVQDAEAEALSETMDKQPSAMAGLYETQADLEGDRFARKAWGKVRTNLRYVR